MSSDLAFLSAIEAAAAFRARTLSPVEYVDALIAQTELAEPYVTATAFRFFDEARAAAREAERLFTTRSADPPPLAGIPLAVKDELNIAGQPVTYGSLIYADNIADSTSPMAERLLAAGAIVHLRTTTPEFACAGFTHSRIWGVSHNPWNVAYDIGGSSGGSAAAVAAGMAPLATGSDIGGSIRIPASCCGVVGYKPPYGRIPQSPPFSLDHYCHEGPLARTVADTALFTNITAGMHPQDVVSLPKPADLPLNGGTIAGRRIALCATLGDYPVDADVLTNLQATAAALREAGAVIEEVTLPWTRAQIIRASGIHYGAIFGPSVQHAVREHRDLMTDYAIDFAERMAAYMTPGAVLEGLAIEGEIYSALAPIFAHYDALLCPTVAVPALDAGVSYVAERISVAGEAITMWEHMMTVPFNICSRLPVLAVPSGFAASGVPTGVSIVGRPFDDATVFEVGYAVEEVRPWQNTRPSFPVAA